MDRKTLTPKQEAFCHAYIEERGNASAAYRRVYDAARSSATTVSNNAYGLLSHPGVAARVEELRATLVKKSDITKERVLDELALILDSNIADYVELRTDDIERPQTIEEIAAGLSPQIERVQRLVFKDFAELSQRQLRAVESIKMGQRGFEIRLHGKSWTIERICKMLGFDAPGEVRIVDDVQQSPLSDLPLAKLEEIERLINDEA